MIEKKLRGAFLSILGTIARPLFASAAGALGREVLKRIGKKYLGEKNVVEKEGQKGIDMPRNNICFEDFQT